MGYLYLYLFTFKNISVALLRGAIAPHGSATATGQCWVVVEKVERCESVVVVQAAVYHEYDDRVAGDEPRHSQLLWKVRLLDPGDRIHLHRFTPGRVLGPRPLLQHNHLFNIAKIDNKT